MDVVQRALRVIAIVCVVLAAVVVVTGWRVDASSITSFVSGLAPRSNAQRGETLYQTFCETCHGGPDTSGRAPYPPPHNASGQTWQLSDCEIVTIVQDGGDATTRALRAAKAPPGAVEMPAFGPRLTRDDIVAVLSYIKTMWTPDQRAAQENTTRASCPSS